MSFRYFLYQESNQFLLSIAIRSLALGMIFIYEPIYLYNYFNSLPLTVLFFALIHGLFALLVVFGGKIMAKIGLRYTILISHFLFLGYFLSLFFLYHSILLIPLVIFLRAMAMSLFWPAFHIDFIRFSERGYHGRQVGRMNVAFSMPTIIGPIVGGAILGVTGYSVLFIAVLIVLLISSFPLFLSKESHLIYSDSLQRAWQRMFKRENYKTSLAMAADGTEGAIGLYLWPLFMFALAIDYAAMGGIVTFSLFAATLFTLYMGRISDKIVNRVEFLNIGSFLTSIVWIIKYFVATAFDAFLAHTLYRICRTSASIPFQTFIYKKAYFKGKEVDEFIIYREIVLNLSRFIFFLILAGIFVFAPQINLAFVMAAVISLGFMFLGVPPKFKF